MYLIAILAAILSFVSPFWGLFLIVGFGTRYNVPKQNRVFWIVNLSVMIVIFITGKNQISTLNFLDALIGSSLLSFIFIWALNSSKNFTKAIFLAFLIGLIYSVVRYYLYSSEITKTVQTAYDLYQKYLDKNFPDKQKLMILKDFMWKTRNILVSYQIAIWNISEMFFFYLGMFLFIRYRKNNRDESDLFFNEIHQGETVSANKYLRMPYISVYLLIVFLLMSIISPTKHLGYNLTLSLATLFAIQGFSILDFFWGKFFRKSKILLFLLIISLIFNTFVLILITLMGLLDIWIDFRKLREEN